MNLSVFYRCADVQEPTLATGVHLSGGGTASEEGVVASGDPAAS